MTDTNTRPPQERICGYEYTVKRGDSFYLIAHRLGVPLRDLLEANSDINPARLMVGDVLCIPMEEDDRPPETPTTPVEPSTPMEPSTPSTPETDTEDDLDQPAMPGEVMDEEMAVCPENNRQTVQEGQTISDIQLSSGLNLHTLQLANPNTNLDALTAGQVLCVPEENVACEVSSTYMLQNGDTLESAALRLNVSVGALLRANPCLAPADFTQGVCITVPK